MILLASTGYITVHAYTSNAQLPLEDVAITVTAADETPGLGAKATSDEFKSQFVGLTVEDTIGVTKDKNGGTIDAISGATITSRAVCGGVSDAIELYNSVKGAN